MKMHWVVCVVASLLMTLAVCLMAQQPAENPLAPYIPKNMKPYFLDVLEEKDSGAGNWTQADQLEWMKKHLGYAREQAEAGKIVLMGPVRGESRLRGIAVIQASSLEEAQKIASGDPLVKSGHLTVEVHPILLEDLSSVKFEYPSLK